MEEYALNNFPEIASKDPLRLLDLGNDAQILYDTFTGNKTGETDRASKNILHVLGKPYSISEIAFNTLTNLSPVALGGLTKMLGKTARTAFRTGKRMYQSGKPYYRVTEGVITTPTGRKSWKKFSDKVLQNLKEGDKISKYGNKVDAGSVTKEGLKKLAIESGKEFAKGAIPAAGKTIAAKSVYGITRPKLDDSVIKPIITSILNLDFEDPARFNQEDVELAYKILFGSDAYNQAMSEGASPRRLISEMRSAMRERPDLKKIAPQEFLKHKEGNKNDKQ